MGSKVDDALEAIQSLNKSQARLLLDVLISDHPELAPDIYGAHAGDTACLETLTANRDTIKQDLFISKFFESKGSKTLAMKAASVSPTTLSNWEKDPGFRAKMSLLREEWSATLLPIALGKAQGGDNEMLKFLLTNLNREVFDSGYARQILANQGTQDAINAQARFYSREELAALIKDDPMQAYLAVDDKCPE